MAVSALNSADMSKNERKMAVLRSLQRESGPIGLPELLKRLGEDAPSQRSLRRWLQELHEQGLIERSGKKRGTRYCAAFSGPFSQHARDVIERVRRPLYMRDPVPYARHWFDSYIPNESYYIPRTLRAQLHAAGNRSSKHEPAGTYARHIYNRLLIDLSFNSSRLEGNSYSLVDTQKLLLEGQSAEGKLDEDRIMILNHREGIRYLVDQSFRLEVDVHCICTLHYLLADGLLETQYAGRVRNHAVSIGGSTYRPYEDERRLGEQLTAIALKAAEIEDPYEQSFFLLVHLSYLQAFADVNKRTARLCSNISLIKHNLVPLSFNDIARDDYCSAMIAIYEEQEVRPLVDLYAFSYLRTCVAYDTTVESMGFDEVRVRYRSERRRILRHVVTKLLKGQSLTDYVKDQAKVLIPAAAQEAFVEDVWEDLDRLSPERIAGLGFTEDDLRTWKELSVELI